MFSIRVTWRRREEFFVVSRNGGPMERRGKCLANDTFLWIFISFAQHWVSRWRSMRRDGIASSDSFEFYWRFSIGFCSLGTTIISFENLKQFFFWKAFPQSGGSSWSLWASFWSFCSFTPHGKRARSSSFDLLRLFRSDKRAILLVSCVVLIAVFILKLVLGISVIPRLGKFYLFEDGIDVVLRWNVVAIKKAALDLSLELLSILLAILGTFVLIRHIKARDTPVSAPTVWLYFHHFSSSEKYRICNRFRRHRLFFFSWMITEYPREIFSSCIVWKKRGEFFVSSRDEGLMETRGKCLRMIPYFSAGFTHLLCVEYKRNKSFLDGVW